VASVAEAQLRLPRVVVLRPQAPMRRPRPAPPTNHEFSLLAQVPLGYALTVNLADGRVLIGRMVSANHDGLTVKVDGRMETLTRESIDQVAHYASAARARALRGSISGVVTAFTFTLLADDDGPEVRAFRRQAMTAGAILGAIGGGLMGATEVHQELLYHRPPPA
jgi:hypothetical protein